MLKKIVLLAVTALLLTATNAYPAAIKVLVSDNSSSTMRVIKRIEKTLDLKQPLAVRLLSQNWQSGLSKNDLLLAIGTPASKALITKKLPNPQVYAFVSAALSTPKKDQQWSAVPIEPSFTSLFAVSEKIASLRFKKNIVIVLSDTNQKANKIAKQQAANHPNVQIVTVKAGEVAAKKVKRYLYEAAALIAIKDKAIWSGSSAKWLLHQTYNHRVPVIGYSKSFLKAGALVSAYSSLDEIADQTAAVILNWRDKGEITDRGMQYAKYTVAVNPNIARALGITSKEIQFIEGEADAPVLN